MKKSTLLKGAFLLFSSLSVINVIAATQLKPEYSLITLEPRSTTMRLCVLLGMSIIYACLALFLKSEAKKIENRRKFNEL